VLGRIINLDQVNDKNNNRQHLASDEMTFNVIFRLINSLKPNGNYIYHILQQLIALDLVHMCFL
jgi:hypothetical protein